MLGVPCLIVDPVATCYVNAEKICVLKYEENVMNNLVDPCFAVVTCAEE